MNKYYLITVALVSYLLTILYPIFNIHIEFFKVHSYLISIMSDIYQLPLSFALYFGVFYLISLPLMDLLRYFNDKSVSVSQLILFIKDRIAYFKKILYVSILSILCISFSEWFFQLYYGDSLDSFGNSTMLKITIILAFAILVANIIHAMIKILRFRKET
jgi:hypothetical protein